MRWINKRGRKKEKEYLSAFFGAYFLIKQNPDTEMFKNNKNIKKKPKTTK